MAKKKLQDQSELVPSVVTPADVCIAYKQVFGTQEGMIVLADLMRRFAFNRNSTFDGRDVNLMLTREGARQVLIHIGIQIDLDPASLEAQEKVTL